MKIESCKQQKPIHRLYYGNCRSGGKFFSFFWGGGVWW